MTNRLLLAIFLVLAMAGWGWGAGPYYVSQSATNGYQIGNDGNNGLAKATPFLTIGKAISVYNAGEIIWINDGTYLTTDGAQGAAYFTLTKAVTINPETSLGVTITSTSAFYTIYINPSATGTYTLGALILNSNETSASSLVLANTAHSPTLILNGTKALNFTLRGFVVLEDNPALIDINSAAISCTAMTNGGLALSIAVLASGNVDINGLVLDITSTGTAIDGVKILSSTGTGSTASVKNVTGTIDCVSLSSGAISVTNVPSADISGNNITINVSALAGGYGIRNATGSGSLIYDNIIAFNAIGGYGIHSNGATTSIYNNTVSNNNTDQAKTPHGITIVDTTGGDVYNNTVSGFAPAFLGSKTDATTIFHHNIVNNPYGNYQLLCKGATGTKYEYNRVYATTGHNGVGLALQQHVDLTNNTDVEFTGNIIYNTSPSPIFVICAANQVGILTNNIYFASDSLIATSWQYSGTSYATLADWQAGVESTAIWGFARGLTPSLGLSPGNRPPFGRRP